MAIQLKWLGFLVISLIVNGIFSVKAEQNFVAQKLRRYSSCYCKKGTETILLGCVDEERGEFASNSFCNELEESSIHLNSCEDKQSCLHRWQAKEWSNCTRDCGSGTRKRSLECVSRGQLKIAADISKCHHQEKPIESEVCNEIDCLPYSVFLGWSECSRVCGDGVRYRQIDCLKRLANGSIVASNDCDTIDVIANLTKPCYNQPCEFDNSNFIKAVIVGDDKKRKRRGLNLPVIRTGSGNHWQTKKHQTVFAVIGEKVSAVEGTKIFLKCVYGGRPEPRATWFFNGRRIDNNRRLGYDYSYKDYLTSLGIPSLKEYLAGKYECQIENKDGRLRAASIVRMIRPGEATIFSQKKILSYGPDVKTAIITIGTNVTLYDNTELKILCPVQAYPYRHRVRWNIEDAASTKGISRYGLYGTDLIIRKTKVQHSGQYTCRGETLWGSDKESSYITIKGKVSPKIISESRHVIGRSDAVPYVNITIGDSLLAEEGARVEIVCLAIGEPKPKIIWQRRGVPIQLPNMNMFVKEDSSILVIKSIKHDSADAYSCLATNLAGQDSATTKISVLPKDASAPKIKSKYGTITVAGEKKSQSATIGQKIKVFEGKSLALYCPVQGIPKPNLLWKFKDEKVEDTSGTNFMVDKTGGALLIFDISKKIEGTYTCEAENPLGKESASSTLKVLSSSYPSVISRSHDIKTGKENTTVSIVIGDRLKTSAGRKIRIICAVEGWPMPKVIWNKDGKAVKSSVRKMNAGVAGGEILTLDNAVEADSGVYTCYAMNPAGVAMSSSTIEILASGSPVITSKTGTKKLIHKDKNSRVSIGTNVTAPVGNAVTIVCPFEGTTDSQVTWTVDKQPINYNKRIRKTADNSLRIENLKFFDSGVYMCKVWNAEGHDSQKTLLTVSGAHNSILKVSNRKSKIESYNADEDLHVVIGHDITLTEKHNVHITCPVRGAARPKIKWLKNNSPINTNSRIFFEGEQLLLSDVRAGDSGSYSCVAITRFGSSNSTTQLTVIASTKPVIIRNDRDIKAADISSTMKIEIGDRLFAVKDMTVEIKCPVKEAVPKPRVFWRHNNAVIISNGVYAQVKDNNDLLIPKLDASLQGLYTCVAENINGKDEASTTILIMLSTPPSIERSDKQITQHASGDNDLAIDIGDNLKTNSGHDVIINCKADGIPKPRVLWTKDGAEVLEDEQTMIFGNGSLKIVNAEKDDTGKYTCTVMNSRGVDKYTSRLKIVDNDSPMIMTDKPEDMTHFDSNTENLDVQVGSNITSLDGKSLTLSCPVTGDPKPHITWYKDGVQVKEGDRVSFGSDNQLIIKNIIVNDAAVYTCLADNGRGRDKVTSVVNVVVPLDRLIPEPEEIEVTDLRSNYLSKKMELEVGMSGILLSGKTVTIKCPTMGSLKPKITWLLGDQVIESDEKHLVKDDVLIVKGQRSGEFQYTCKAESIFGAKEETSILNILDPIKPSITATNNNKLSTDHKVRVDIGGKIKVKMGSQLDIKCPYTGIPVPEIAWFRNTRKLTETDNVIIKGTGSILRLPYVTMEDAGSYMCAASNGVGQKAKQSIMVQVYKPSSAAIKIDTSERIFKQIKPKPTIITEENKVGNIGQNYSILAGMKLVLKCPVSGDPKPDIIWLKNGEIIARNVETLQFDDANDVDSGEYICKAVNVFGTQTMSSKVKVMKQQKPLIQRDPTKGAKTEVISSVSGKGSVAIDIGDDLKTLTGTEVSIKCPAIGVPKPNVVFMKNGKIIENDDTFEFDAENGILTIKITTKQTNGEYQCVAKNSAGSYNLTTNLQLLDPVAPSIIEKKSTPTYGYNILKGKGYLYGTVGIANISAYPGTEVYIDCPVAGFPVPHVFWSRNGKRIMNDDSFANVEKNGTLILPHLTSGIQGTYECFAVNVAGGYSRNLTVSVTDPTSPIIFKETGLEDLSQTLKANVTIGKNVVVLMGAEVVIRCPLKAEPAATVIWSGERGYELEQRDVIELDQGRTLKIRKVTKISNGVYKCIASNIFGSDYALTRITVAESLKPVITMVKENVTTYMGNNEVSVVIGGHLDAPSGTVVTITCPVSGTPSPKVSWFFNGNLLTETKLAADSGTASYTLNKLKLKHSGKYTCRAENVLGKDEASTFIYVGMVPAIQSSSNKNTIISAIKQDSVTVPIGGKAIVSTSAEVVLQCFSRGIPAPHISWYKNGILLEPGSPYLSVIKGLLDIPSVAPSDDGTFTCIARNKFGIDKATSKIAVVDPPTIIGETKNKTAIEPSSRVIHASIGGSVTVLQGVQLIVSCPARGTPTPKIKWRRIDAFFNIDPRVSLTPEGDLQIKNVESSDAGTYVCMAENKAGKDEKSLKIEVAEPPSAQVSSSRFNAMRRAKAPAMGVVQRIIVSKNQNITITCSVQGNPLPRIQWFKEGESIHIDGRKYFAEGDELSILNVVEKDAGNYRCIAENLAGKNMATVKVIIGEKPKIRKSNDRIMRILPSTLKAEMGQSIGVRQHSVVMVVCDVIGSPRPDISWTKNGGEIDFSLLAESSRVLLLKDVSSKDAGNYTCMAQNEIGQDKATTEVIVIEPAVMISPSMHDLNAMRTGIDAVLRADREMALHAIEDEEIKVVCIAEGYPSPKIEWQKNMHPLLEKTDQTYWTVKQEFINSGEKLVSRVESVLTIKKVQTSEFEIRCKSFNEAGKSDAKLVLHIHDLPVPPYTGVWISTGVDDCKGKCIGAFRALNIIENKCLSYGNKAVSLDKCDPSKRPAEIRECRTKSCGTSWGIGPWGECSAKCGNKGLRKRTVKCMFKNGADAAKDTDCGHILPRKPRKYEACNRKPCEKDLCVDNQSYCTMVKSLGYCRTEWSKEQCCFSCRNVQELRN